MSIVVYKCDVCKREIELVRNIEGLEKINRCTITQGCRGKLFHQSLHVDFIRGSLPDDAPGLDNWVQRKVLYNHEQPIQREEWIIPHNLGVAPVVVVFVDRPIDGDPDNQEEIIPDDVFYESPDVAVLKFSQPYSGIAQLIGRQSDPDLLRPFQRTTVQPAEPIQLSLNGEITIATRIDADQGNVDIGINLRFDTSGGTPPVIPYLVDDQPSINSAWIDFNKVVVNGKIYTVRSFSGLVPEITTGSINSGSTFRFESVDWENNSTVEPIEKGEMLILLATSPFQLVDKQKTKFIDVTSVTATENIFGLYYDSGEFFATETIAQSVYPPIRSV